MLRNIQDDSPDRDSPEGASNNRVIQSLSCPDCAATNFPNLSKLNKHRNRHERPYECLAEGCYDRFAQRQALTRHTETKHSDAATLSKFYHCTVDGCKYASSGRWRKRFTRADQVKEHIKEYGHYGPHSANDRPRRPGERLLETDVITARYEEWIVDEKGGSQPRRTVQKCEYNSFKTRLWHTDVPGELFLKGDEKLREGHRCSVEGCYYYELQPPPGCEKVAFKTPKGLQEHIRRAHGLSGFSPSLGTQVGEDEKRRTAERDSISTDSYSTRTLSVYSDSPYSQLDLLGLGLDTSGLDHMNEMEWNKMVPPDLSDICFAGDGIDCCCQSCCQRGTSTPQQSESMVTQLSASSSDMQTLHVPGLSMWSSLHDTDHIQSSEPSTDTENYRLGLPSSKSVSLFRHDSLKSRASRIPCDFINCTSTFRRKYEKQRHMETIHSSATPHSCHLCDSKFRRQDKLFAHLRSKHATQPNSESKTKSMVSDTLDFSTSSAFSVPGFLSGRDVVPGDLVKANTSLGRWRLPGNRDSFAEYGGYTASAQRASWSVPFVGWRPVSPRPIPSGTSESPICIDEPTPNVF